MLNRERPLTWADLAAMPEDNLRREIIGGELIVTPAPDGRHQEVVIRLLVEMRKVAPEGAWTLTSPFEVRLSGFDSVQPDVLYLSPGHRDRMSREYRLSGAPDIVAEVVSPSSTSIDRIRKFTLYARSGVPEYWIIDPRNLAIDVYALTDGEYERIEPDIEGRYRSRVLPALAVHPDTLFAGLG